MATDWLVGDDRRTAGAERIYAAAADLIAGYGFDRFDIESLAQAVHCSRATLYRHVGGKAQIHEQVLSRQARRINDIVLAAVEHLPPRERAVEAIATAVREIRSDQVIAQLLVPRRQSDLAVFIDSATITAFAAENIGLDPADSAGARWVTRVIFSMLLWPGASEESEVEMLRRFVGPAFTG